MEIVDALSNSHIIYLSNCLQKNDYNKQFQINYYQFLQRKERKRNKNEKKKKKNLAKKVNPRTSVKGFIKIDTFYEEFNFIYQGIADNWATFKKIILEGVSRKEYNYVATLSSASVIAFIDCEGIVSENERYANEIAMFDEDSKKVIIDLLHDPYVENEKDLYVFEKMSDLYQHNTLKKPLSVAMGNAINPEYGNKNEFLKPIFKLPDHLKKRVEKNSDEYFLSRFKKNEIIPHLDCMCSLAHKLGYSEKDRKQMFAEFSFWDIKNKTECDIDNIELAYDDSKNNSEEAKSDHGLLKKNTPIKNKISRHDFKLDYDSGDNVHAASEGQISPRNSRISLIDSLDDKSRDEYSEADAAKTHFKEMELRQLYIKNKEKGNYYHCVSTVCKDLKTKINEEDKNKDGAHKSHMFSRGDPFMIIQNCTDYWNGTEVAPLNKMVLQSLKDIIKQWALNDLDAVAFAYRPAIPQLYKYIKSHEYENSSSKQDIQLIRRQQDDQIFLGMLGVKEHSRREMAEVFKSFGQDGSCIRCVIFCKEGPMETKTLGGEIGLNTDWNSCISLSDEMNPYTHLKNRDGNLILPYGIKGIKQHLETVDEIPLQIPMFCDCYPMAVKEMIIEYQKRGEVVICVGNVVNIDNIRIFNQADLSIGMVVSPSQRCKSCKGLKRGYTPQTDSSNLGFKLNSLPCAFVYEANTNIYSLFTLLREARRLKNGQQQGLLLCIFIYLILLVNKVFDISMGLPASTSNLQTYILCFISVPTIALSYLMRPISNSVMKKCPITKRYMHHVTYHKRLVYVATIKIFISSCIIELTYLLNYYFMLIQFKDEYPDELSNVPKDVHFYDIGELLWGEIYLLRDQHNYWDLNVVSNQAFICVYTYLLFVLFALEFEHERYSIYTRRNMILKNKYLMILLVSNLVISIIYYALYNIIMNVSEKPKDFYFPNYICWIIMIFHMLVLIIIEPWTKKYIRNLYNKNHTTLKLFYETKLGTYSPR